MPAHPASPLLRRMLATLGVAVGVFAVLLVSVALSLLKHSEQLALQSGREQVERVVSVTEGVVNRNLVSVDMLLAETADWVRELPPLLPGKTDADTRDGQGLQRLLKAALNQNLMLRDVAVLDSQGHVLFSAKPATRRLGLALPEGFLDKVLAQPYPSLQISGPQINSAGPDRSLFFARPVELAGQRKAVALAEVHLPLVASLMDPGDPKGQMWVTLERDNGELLASHPALDVLTGQMLNPPLNASLANGMAQTGPGRLSAAASLLATRPTLYAGILISAGLPRSAVLADWQQESRVVLGVTAVLLLVVLVTAGLLWVYVARLSAARTQVARANAQLRQANENMAQSLSLVQATLESTADALLVVGTDGKLKHHNRQFLLAMGLTEDTMQSQSLDQIRETVASHMADPGHFLRTTREAYENPHQETRDQIELKDGRVLVRHSLPQLLHGEPVGRVWSFQDVTHFKRAEASLRAQQEALNLAHSNLAATVEAIPDLLFELAEDGSYLDYRAGRQDLLATPPPPMIGRRVQDALPPTAAREVMAALAEAKERGHSYGRQIALKQPQGKTWFELSVARKKGLHNGQARFILIARDISMRKQHENLIWNQANYDALTGLPNRRMFRDHLETRLAQARASGEHLALMFLDLDRFKEINDTHGHDMGDHLLQTAAQRLRAAVRETDMVARMGGDEFTLLISGNGVGERATALCTTLLQRMGEPFHLGTELDYVSASIGITLFPDDAPDAETLIKQADQAMYAAKRLGRNRFERFTAAMQEATLVRSRVARDLRGALAGQQFWLAYQPVVDMRTGAIHKAEALIRWEHPTQGAVSPATFIPIAEESGSIHDIGQWVFETAAAQVAQWRQTLHPGFQVSINTSPLQYQRQGLQPEALQAHLSTLGLDGSSLVLEITEGLLMDASAATRQQLGALHTAGFEISLDDFGTGYSALSYLHQFDLDYLKIDQSFVRDLHAGSKDLALCKATIVMAHELGLKVVAEGIETEEQRELLAQAGCDFGQGYLFSRPVSAADFEALLATHATNA